MTLSIIIPFYGVQKYIGECLLGLENLPKDDCEILLVDDCGTDGSLAIAKDFCRKYDNARIIYRTKNGGLSAARNTGLRDAVGEYVYFLDSDDIPDGQAIYDTAKLAGDEQLDVIKGRFSCLCEAEKTDDSEENNAEDTVKATSNEMKPGPQVQPTQIISGAELFISESREGTYEPMVWQCIYNRNYLQQKQIEMQEGMLFEDELFTTPALILANRVKVTDRQLLTYRMRSGSIMSSIRNHPEWSDYYIEICRKLSTFNQYHPEAKDVLALRIANIALSLGKNIPAYHIEGENRNRALWFLRENRKEIALYTQNRSARLPLSVRLQGRLMQLSPNLFVWFYEKAARSRKKNGYEWGM